MNPARVDRARVRQLTDLPNIGKAMADDLRRLGIREPAQLKGKIPFELYERLVPTHRPAPGPVRARRVHVDHGLHER